MIKLKSLLKENAKRWSAVVIDESSRDLLLSTYKSLIPDGWETIAHHMTINPFGLVDDSEVGKNVTLKVIAYGKTEKAFAVKVSGYDKKTNNKFPHITIAINRSGGAKPKDSNDISEWTEISDGISLNGKIENL